MYAMGDDNNFQFHIHSLQPATAIAAPEYTVRDNDALAHLAHMQSQEEEQKRTTFEATEATIVQNRRSQVKKIKARKFSVGNAVLFKIPIAVALLQL